MKVSKNFVIQEFVDSQTYNKFKNRSIWFIDNRIFNIVQYLRDTFGSITINDWTFGNHNEWRGLRTIDSVYYNKYSQHSFGRAVDMIFKEVSADTVRNYILENEDKFREMGVGGLEKNVSWVHLDLRNVLDDKIFLFNK